MQSFVAAIADPASPKLKDRLLTALQDVSRSPLLYLSSAFQTHFFRFCLQSFVLTDRQLLQYARDAGKDYTATTAVTVTLLGKLLTVAHVGDSKVAIGQVTAGAAPVGWYLTYDHKPNNVDELKRIKMHGGECVFLHGDKPYLRGGDFLARKDAIRLGEPCVSLSLCLYVFLSVSLFQSFCLCLDDSVSRCLGVSVSVPKIIFS